MRKKLALIVVILWTLQQPAALAIVGVNSASPGIIGNQHITFASSLDLGRTVGFVSYSNSNATGTLVPSLEAGTLKFLTAAHNVDHNNDGVLDAGLGTIIFYFGNAPGENGGTATYSVTATATQIAVNPLWATKPGGPTGGTPTNDLAVVSFKINQVTTVTAESPVIQASAVSSASPVGMAGVVAGHGLHSDGTVILGGSAGAGQQVDGILKGGTNTIDFVGVPTITVGGTINDTSGTVILLDLDKPDGSTSTLGATTGGPNEAGTAKGDSGSALYADTNKDGKLEVVGVLNGGDNPYPTGVSTFGDISQYAPILTPTNLAFLKAQNVFVGTSLNGVSAGNYGGVGFMIADGAGLNNFTYGLTAAMLTQSQGQQVLQGSLGTVQTRTSSVARGTSNLENVGGDEVTLSDLAGFGSRRWEAWAASNLARVDSQGRGSRSSGLDAHYGAATVGVDFLATSHVMLGAYWSYLYGRGSATDLKLDSSGNALGFTVVGEWYGLCSTFIYNYSHAETDLRRSIGTAQAFAKPSSSSHTLDWMLAYNLRHRGWVHGPTGGLRYTFGNVGGYTEQSDTPVPGLLSANSQDFSVFRLNLGYNAAYHFETNFGKVVPYLSANWIYLAQHSSSSTASYQGTPFSIVGSGGGLVPFSSGPSTATGGSGTYSNFANVQMGVELIAHERLKLNLQTYVSVFRSGTMEVGGGVQVGFIF